MTEGSLYVLIGAAGFMGGAFAKHLRKNGHEVCAVRRGDRLADLPGDPHLGAHRRRCIVVDFAYTSVPNSSFEDPIRDYSDNLYNVLRHIDIVKQLPDAVYVYISSGGTVYGNPTGAVAAPINEEHPNVPLSPYGITKLACERYVLMYREVHGLDVRIVRPSNVYGEGQKPFRGQGIVATVLARLLRGEPVQVYGDGSIVRDYLHVDDFCAGLHDAIRRGGNGETYNLGSGLPLSIGEMLQLMQARLDLPDIEIEHLPTRPFDVRYNVLDSSKLRALAGWRPSVSMDDGLSRTAAWLLANA